MCRAADAMASTEFEANPGRRSCRLSIVPGDFQGWLAGDTDRFWGGGTSFSIMDKQPGHSPLLHFSDAVKGQGP